MTRNLARLLGVAAILVAAGAGATEPPRVVASIPPVHSLVASVMAGIGEPRLLLKGAASPHNYSMKPADARMLDQATVVFWVGEDLESFLAKPLRALAGKARIVALLKEPGMRTLKARDADDDGHGPKKGQAQDRLDTHLWLDPANARMIVEVATRTLAEIDPANAATYRRNADATNLRLTALDGRLRAELAPLRDKRFVVFHDAYQYFERAFDLMVPEVITVNPDRPPRARKLREIREKIANAGVSCVFGEPQFESKLIDSLIAGTNARAGVLDPDVGTGLVPGPDLYPTLMENNARALIDCLLARGGS